MKVKVKIWLRRATCYGGCWCSLVTGKSLALKKVGNGKVMGTLAWLFVGELVSLKKSLYLELRLLILRHAFSRWFTLLNLPLLGQHIILSLRHLIRLLMLRIIRASVWINIMWLHVLTIDNSSMCWIGIPHPILAKSRFSEISLKCCVGKPSCLLLEFL